MKKKTTVTEKYNDEGKLIEKITIVEEEDEITDINIQRPQQQNNNPWGLQWQTAPVWTNGTAITSGYIRGSIINGGSIDASNLELPQTYTNVESSRYYVYGESDNISHNGEATNGEQQQ